MPNPLQSKRILLGITGSIACYKSADLAPWLTLDGLWIIWVLNQ